MCIGSGIHGCGLVIMWHRNCFIQTTSPRITLVCIKVMRLPVNNLDHWCAKVYQVQKRASAIIWQFFVIYLFIFHTFAQVHHKQFFCLYFGYPEMTISITYNCCSYLMYYFISYVPQMITKGDESFVSVH